MCRKSCTRTKRENSVKIRAKNKSSEQRVCRSSTRTQSGTRTKLPDTNRDEHPAYSFQQFHLPFHVRFVTLDLCSQDLQCEPTAEHHSNNCSELHMCHLCACLVNLYSRWSPDHEVRAAKLTNRWISVCWWGRDASSDEHLVGTKHGLLECRSVRRKPPGEQWSRP